jgi:thiamine pyrophosphate-dependent acetolactate synthase large subunit-like protein
MASIDSSNSPQAERSGYGSFLFVIKEAEVFMACVYAKLTGRLGVCIATSGPEAFTS